MEGCVFSSVKWFYVVWRIAPGYSVFVMNYFPGYLLDTILRSSQQPMNKDSVMLAILWIPGLNNLSPILCRPKRASLYAIR